MTREEFIAKNAHLFWYIKKEAIPKIGNEVLVEFIFNYGTWQDVKDLIKIIGYPELKRVYEDITDRKIGNYIPEMLDLMGRITHKYAS
ncbi:MAG TPA: hypothetical protein DCM02_02150 [Flavobacterium sp.]|nr:hypothetical protein [Flavobacterium sp.]HAT76782.1 hypothetical protein [Flavobacterium sp.]